MFRTHQAHPTPNKPHSINGQPEPSAAISDKERAAKDLRAAALLQRQAALVSLQAAQTMRRVAERELLRVDNSRRPSVVMRPEIRQMKTPDGWAFMAHYHDVVGIGDTPDLACDNFDSIWMFGDASQADADEQPAILLTGPLTDNEFCKVNNGDNHHPAEETGTDTLVREGNRDTQRWHREHSRN